MEQYEIEELINEKIHDAVYYNIIVGVDELEEVKYIINQLKDENERLWEKIKSMQN